MTLATAACTLLHREHANNNDHVGEYSQGNCAGDALAAQRTIVKDASSKPRYGKDQHDDSDDKAVNSVVSGKRGILVAKMVVVNTT
jgi:hypothetical protein